MCRRRGSGVRGGQGNGTGVQVRHGVGKGRRWDVGGGRGSTLGTTSLNHASAFSGSLQAEAIGPLSEGLAKFRASTEQYHISSEPDSPTTAWPHSLLPSFLYQGEVRPFLPWKCTPDSGASEANRCSSGHVLRSRSASMVLPFETLGRGVSDRINERARGNWTGPKKRGWTHGS